MTVAVPHFPHIVSMHIGLVGFNWRASQREGRGKLRHIYLLTAEKNFHRLDLSKEDTSEIQMYLTSDLENWAGRHLPKQVSDTFVSSKEIVDWCEGMRYKVDRIWKDRVRLSNGYVVCKNGYVFYAPNYGKSA